MVDYRLCERCGERPALVGIQDPSHGGGQFCGVCADYYDNSVDICGCEPGQQPPPEEIPSQEK